MKTRRNRSAQPPAKNSSARARSAAARATPQTGWSSLPDEVACAVLALSSADGFGNAGSVCKRFGRLVSTGAVTVARARAQTRHTWLVCVGGCGRADAQPIMTGDTVAAGWYENARDRVYGRAGCAKLVLEAGGDVGAKDEGSAWEGDGVGCNMYGVARRQFIVGCSAVR